MLIFTILCMIVSIYINKFSESKKYIINLIKIYLIITIILILYLSQYFFYNGIWPTGMRYDFPGLICEVLYKITILYLIYISLTNIGVKIFFAKVIVYILISFIFIREYSFEKYKQFQQASLSNVSRTTNFTYTIEKAKDYLKQHPDTPIIYESHSVWDFRANCIGK